MYQYSNSLIRQFPSLVTGNAAVGVQATVYVGETGTLASLFEVNGSPKSNPVTTDGKGFYSFSLADGDYRIVFSSSQFATLRISVLDGAQIREDFDDLVASNLAFRNQQQAAYDAFVLSQGWDQVGTFAAGFTFTSPNQVGQDSSGNWWRWNGVLPKTVTAGTLPSSDANYKLVGDGVLRSDLANGTADVGGVPSRRLADSPVNGIDFGVLMDDSTNNTSALNALATANKRTELPLGVAQCSSLVPTDSWGILGAGRGATVLKNNTVNSSIVTMSGQFDVELSHMTLTGLGKDSATNENGVTFDGSLNGRRNTFSYLDFSGFSGHCLNFSAGWNNSVYKTRMLSSAIGLNFTESPLLAGWSGSGFKVDESYIATCDVGIQMESIWNFTSINTVIEDCDLPIKQVSGGSPAVWINNWFESNQQSPELSYSNIFIGGRLEGGESPAAGFYDNMSLPAAPFDYECITELLYGIRVFRDPNNEIFKADGQGVKKFKPHSSLGWDVLPTAGTAKLLQVGFGSNALGGGIVSETFGNDGGAWKDVNQLTAARHLTSAQAAVMPKLGVKVQGNTSSSGGGNGFIRVAFSTGSYFTGGGGGTQFADRWQFDENGHLSPFADGAYDIGISGFRVRDMRVVNAPIVGSDQRIKKDIQSIPQPLLDFALSVEIKQYKLKSGTSGRNHYGIVITPGFLTSLAAVQSIDECGAFCQDVFTDMDGNAVTQDVGGVQLGDIWQVRYDEWQNILLEAMRRKVVSL